MYNNNKCHPRSLSQGGGGINPPGLSVRQSAPLPPWVEGPGAVLRILSRVVSAVTRQLHIIMSIPLSTVLSGRYLWIVRTKLGVQELSRIEYKGL